MKLKINFLCTVILAILASKGVKANPSFRLEAKYISSIIPYVNYWPNRAPGDRLYRVCFADNEELYENFRDLSEKSKDSFIVYKTIKITDSTDISEISRCDVIYVSDKNPERAQELFKIATEHKALTISEEDMIYQGAIVALYRVGGVLRFYVNFENLQKSELQISSELLAIANIINFQEGIAIQKEKKAKVIKK